MIGVIKFGKKTTTSKRINNPYLSEILKNANFALVGRKEKKIFDPSSGGIGIKLKIARLTFIRTTKPKIYISGDEESPKDIKPLIIKPKITAIKKFDAGPAMAMSGSAIFLFFKLYGL